MEDEGIACTVYGTYVFGAISSSSILQAYYLHIYNLFIGASWFHIYIQLVHMSSTNKHCTGKSDFKSRYSATKFSVAHRFILSLYLRTFYNFKISIEYYFTPKCMSSKIYSFFASLSKYIQV